MIKSIKSSRLGAKRALSHLIKIFDKSSDYHTPSLKLTSELRNLLTSMEAIGNERNTKAYWYWISMQLIFMIGDLSYQVEDDDFLRNLKSWKKFMVESQGDIIV